MFQNVEKLNIPAKVLLDWQEMTDLLAEIIEVPASLIMRFNDPAIEVFLASNSEGNPYKPGSTEELVGSGLYCERVISTQKVLEISNALKMKEWKNNPDTKLNMISYLGFPLLLPNGTPFGTLCVLDNKEKHFTDHSHKLMGKFKDILESNLELIYINEVLGNQYDRMSDYLHEIQTLRGIVPICAHCKSIRDDQGAWTPIEKWLVKNPETQLSHSLCPDCMKELYGDT